MVFACCVSIISLFFRLRVVHNGISLFLAIVGTVFHSYFLPFSVIRSVPFYWESMLRVFVRTDGWM